MGTVVPIRPGRERENELADLLHRVCLLNPRLRSPNAETRMAARIMLDTICVQASKLGVNRPVPPPKDAA